MTAPRERTLPVWQGKIRMRVLSKGEGPPLVYFHGPWGLDWDPFLDAMAERFTVHAPEHPGTTPGSPDDAYHLDGLWDLVLCYEELLSSLGVAGAAFAGHSFGAMVAAEVAAAYAGRARRLALIAPIGFWREDAPVVNWMLLNPQELAPRIFRDPEGAGARRMFAKEDGEEARVAAQVRLTWAMGATGKFIWPLPDKGLKKRIHRLTHPTLILWGEDDRVVPPVYAEEFSRRLSGARVETLARAGHAPHLERPVDVARLVGDFLEA